jgi:hypothetical protein
MLSFKEESEICREFDEEKWCISKRCLNKPTFMFILYDKYYFPL